MAVRLLVLLLLALVALCPAADATCRVFSDGVRRCSWRHCFDFTPVGTAVPLGIDPAAPGLQTLFLGGQAILPPSAAGRRLRDFTLNLRLRPSGRTIPITSWLVALTVQELGSEENEASKIRFSKDLLYHQSVPIDDLAALNRSVTPQTVRRYLSRLTTGDYRFVTASNGRARAFSSCFARLPTFRNLNLPNLNPFCPPRRFRPSAYLVPPKPVFDIRATENTGLVYLVALKTYEPIKIEASVEICFRGWSLTPWRRRR